MRRNLFLAILSLFIGSNLILGQNQITIQFGGMPIQRSYSVSQIDTATKIKIVNLDGTIAFGYSIISGTVMLNGAPAHGKILEGGFLDTTSISYLKQAKGKNLFLSIKIREPSGVFHQTIFTYPIK